MLCVRARRLRQNFCERSGPQGLQGQLEGLEIRLSERSEFPYFPCSRLRRSCASSCFDGDDGEGRYYKLTLCTIDLKNINLSYINSSSQLRCPGNIPIPPVLRYAIHGAQDTSAVRARRTPLRGLRKLGVVAGKRKKHSPSRVLFLNRQLPILPGRFQPSTFGVCGLNCCVRDGNRWNPTAIVTGLSC